MDDRLRMSIQRPKMPSLTRSRFAPSLHSSKNEFGRRNLKTGARLNRQENHQG